MGNTWARRHMAGEGQGAPSERRAALASSEKRLVVNSLTEASMRLHVHTPELIEEALAVYREIHAGLKHTCAANEVYYVHRHLLAFSLWEALNRKRVPRPPLTLASAFDVRLKGFLKYESHLKGGITYCAPVQYVETIGRMLRLPFFVILAAKQLCRMYGKKLYDARPENVAAASLVAVAARAGEGCPSPPSAQVCELVGLTERTLFVLRERLLAFDFEMYPNPDTSSPLRFKFKVLPI